MDKFNIALDIVGCIAVCIVAFGVRDWSKRVGKAIKKLNDLIEQQGKK